ncbi:MAG: hypothetical protein Q9216_003556 [Gyalolechia sp. 2 TL-2023]
MRIEADKVAKLKAELSAAVQKLQDLEEGHRAEMKNKTDEMAGLQKDLSTINGEVTVAANEIVQPSDHHQPDIYAAINVEANQALCAKCDAFGLKR